YLQDGTVISLPSSLAQQWPGGSQEAALRVQGRLELGSGSLAGLWLQAGREPERSGPAITTPLPVGSLFHGDMGYFTLSEMGQRQGKRKGKKISAARLRLADWTIVLTHVPQAQLSVQEALVLLRVRWQIELLWKLWKQHGKLETWRSYKPERILTEFSAKLL